MSGLEKYDVADNAPAGEDALWLVAKSCKHDSVTFKITSAVCASCGKVIPPLRWDEIKKFYVREK